MRLLQKEETASLPVWLSRDVPHERELAGEFLDRMGREKSLAYLLHLHDVEETRRQKRLTHYTVAVVSCAVAMLFLCAIVLYTELATPSANHLPWLRVCVPIFWVCSALMHLLNFQAQGGRQKKTPLFSSVVQQNVITSLMDYPNSPLVADALCRALYYYKGDQNHLYDRLTRVLPLLPDAPDGLTKPARRALHSRLLYVMSEKNPKLESLPALQAAIRDYFDRTGESCLRSNRNQPKARRD